MWFDRVKRILGKSIGTRKAWRSVFLAIIVVLCFSPAISAGWWHLHNRTTLECQNFSLQMPLLWTGPDDKDQPTICKEGLSMFKRAPTIFGSEDDASMLFLIQTGQPQPKGVDLLVEAFKDRNRGAKIEAYSLNSRFTDCLIAENTGNGKHWVDLECNPARGLRLSFSGSRHALSEASTFVR